jgi:tRNA modification GTPase
VNLIDTIAALSTAQGPGAIGILRVSGKKTLSIATTLLYKNNIALTEEYIKANNRSAIFCDFIYQGKPIDQIVFLFFGSPNSYTGEDLGEFHLHGNPILLKKALHAIFESGARPALQGEFTKRSFLNGKSSLTQAEAIGRLIESRSRYELELAQKNVFGEISQLASKIRSDLISLKAECEAEIDFSTEDLTFESLEQRKNRMISLNDLCKKLLRDSERAEKLILQSTVVLFGAPNTGKSSLMNLLIGRDRSIISDIPGTTRDYIAEEISLDGIPIRLVDTAGVRATSDTIEKMGIERSEREADSANLRLILMDVSYPVKKADFLNIYGTRLQDSILVANKIDIAHESWNESEWVDLGSKYQCEFVMISCKSRIGIDQLLSKLKSKLSDTESTEDIILLEERQAFHIEAVHKHLTEAILLLENQTPAEIYIQEINYSLKEIGEVNGRVENEEILGRIFSKFCVGK